MYQQPAQAYGYYAPSFSPQQAMMQSYSRQQPAPTPSGMKGRPVSSLEEARAIPIDFDGSISFFPDIASNKIYTKQINLDGTSKLNVYELNENPAPEIGTADSFVSQEEFKSTVSTLVQEIQSLKGGQTNESTNSNDGTGCQF